MPGLRSAMLLGLMVAVPTWSVAEEPGVTTPGANRDDVTARGDSADRDFSGRDSSGRDSSGRDSAGGGAAGRNSAGGGSAKRTRRSRTSGYDRRAALAVDKALSYLAERQNDDGSWTDRVGRKVYNSYTGKLAPHIGVTALGGMAFLSAGIVPGGGPSGRHWRNGVLIDSNSYRDQFNQKIRGHEIVDRAISYLVKRTSTTGFITDKGSRMYSHAFAALFLAEAYGMGYSRGGQLQKALRRSIRMIESAQNAEGGWRYRPGATDSDMSITVCQVVALRAARNAGIAVSKETIDRAVGYVRRSFILEIGAFTYQLGPEFRGPSRYTFALTAAGATALYGAGEYNSEMLRRALGYMWTFRPNRSDARYSFDYYYGQYYAVQAMFQRQGDDWRRWYDNYIKPDLLALQEKDGSWRDLVGANYATAVGAVILQFPNQYLPITEN